MQHCKPVPVPHSEQNPYHLAVYLRELVQMVAHVTDELPEAPKGLCALVTVIEERAEKLSLLLDSPAFSDQWPDVQRFLADPTAVETVLAALEEDEQA